MSSIYDARHHWTAMHVRKPQAILLPRHSLRLTATLLSCMLVLGGCLGDGEVPRVVVVEVGSQALTIADLRSVNGIYGPTCTGRTGAWSLGIANGAMLDHPELAVVLNDAACQLSITSLVADQTYVASPALALGVAYQSQASLFSAGPVAFDANAKLSSTSNQTDFVMTILFAGDPLDGTGGSSTAARSRRLMSFGDGSDGQGGYNVSVQRSPLQEITASTTWSTATAGTGFGCATRANGTLWCWGLNTNGQVGIGSVVSPQYSPVQVGTNTSWATVSALNAHACAIRTDGTLWCWGLNGNGQLGLGNTTQQNSPVQVGAVNTWSKVTTGEFYSCATRTNGTLWCWGLNASGQLGLGNTTQQNSPVQVGTASNWKAVDAAYDHTCATRTDGTLFCWGINTNGQIGIGSVVSPQLSPVQVGTNTTWSSVTTGGTHSCATRSNGTLFCWGSNASGEVGIGSVVSPQTSPVQVGTDTTWNTVDAGFSMTCATRSAGTLWCWGLNTNGQIGIGSVVSPQTSPVQIGTASNWSAASSGRDHACGKRSNGTLFCWGNGISGQLAIGNWTVSSSAVQVGNHYLWATAAPGHYHSCALRTDGTFWCWGRNSAGAVGIGNLVSPQPVPVQVGTDNTWNSVSAGDTYTCGTRSDGSLRCWGNNGAGQLGIGSMVGPETSPVQVGTNMTWSFVDAGYAHTCALRTNGSVWCWGRNNQAQLGTGDLNNQTSPVQVGTLTTWKTVSAGGEHTCATRTNGTLWCWGRSDSGQLGIGTGAPQVNPVPVGANTNWNSVSCGAYTTCATRTDGTLWCWGLNTSGQVGNGNVVSPQASPVQVGTNTTWNKVSSGYSHTCATRTDNSVWCWGNNVNGQLGLGHTTSPQTSPARVGTGTVYGVFATGEGNTTLTITND
jgi:alpha-tubulin suppressor-like RCC1 family protein